MVNQEKSYRQSSVWAFLPIDGEQDDCDREDDDPNEERQQAMEMSPCA